MERTCKTLSLSQIVTINRQVIKNFGGLPFVEPNNLKNEGSLEYILGAITTTYFGVDLYPTIPAKAAALGWTINAKHVFEDANKRTGLLTCQLFLEINDYDFPMSIEETADAEAVAIALEIAKNEVTLEEFQTWVEKRIQGNL